MKPWSDSAQTPLTILDQPSAAHVLLDWLGDAGGGGGGGGGGGAGVAATAGAVCHVQHWTAYEAVVSRAHTNEPVAWLCATTWDVAPLHAVEVHTFKLPRLAWLARLPVFLAEP